MKKKLLALSLAVACVLSMTACGEATADEKASSASSVTDSSATVETAEEIAAIYAKYSEDPYSYVPSELVKLGDFENMEIELDEALYAFSQADLDAMIQSYIDQYVGDVKDESLTEVTETSIVNIDYVGKLDGVAFEGGTAQDQKIDVAVDATRYISGFTAGLIGHKVGDEFDVPLTFPENYQAKDLAGKSTVFTMKINYIYGKTTVDTLTDEMVVSKIGVSSKAEFIQKVGEIYDIQRNNSRSSAINSAVIDKIMAEAEIAEVPSALLTAMNDGYKAVYQKYADEYGVSLEQLLSDFLKTDLASFEKNANDQNTKSLRQEMVFRALAEALKLEIDEKEFEEFVTNTMSASDITSYEAFVQNYCTNMESNDGYTNLRNSFLTQKALETMIDKVKVVSK